MGQKALEPFCVTAEELPTYLRVNHSAFMDYDGKTYYLTDVNDHFWRVQDTEELNDKGHFCDLTEPVDSIATFLSMPTIEGKAILDLIGEAKFYASEKPEA